MRPPPLLTRVAGARIERTPRARRRPADLTPRPGFIDARGARGVPRITTLPDPRVDAFLDSLGMEPLIEERLWMQAMMRNL